MATSRSSIRSSLRQWCCNNQDQTTNLSEEQHTSSTEGQPTNSEEQPTKSSICKVHKNLRRVKCEAYEPYLVSIGPYHHGKDDLEMMQARKLNYLSELGDVKINQCRDAIIMLKNRIENSYEKSSVTAESTVATVDPVDSRDVVDQVVSVHRAVPVDRVDPVVFFDRGVPLDPVVSVDHVVRVDLVDPVVSVDRVVPVDRVDPVDPVDRVDPVDLVVPVDCVDPVVEMMLEDGVLIIQLVRKFDMRHLVDPNDPVFKLPWVMNSVQRDLLLLENQIPFFILNELFGIIEQPNKVRLIGLFIKFFENLIPEPSSGRKKLINYSNASPNHLVDLIHVCWRPGSGSFPLVIDRNNENRVTISPVGGRKGKSHNSNQIPTASELTDAGVTFENKKEGKSLFDITFECGNLYIPPFSMDYETDCFLRNLVAYEQHYLGDNHKAYVTDYVKFLDCLINSPKDVEILRRKDIIESWLGDNEVVARIFNKITDYVVLPGEDEFHYAEVFRKINAHCQSTLRSSLTSLKRNYLNGAWGYISVLAATILLLLTGVQTYLSYLQVKHG